MGKVRYIAFSAILPMDEHMIQRRQTRQISVGQLSLGGNAPIRVQSMTNTNTRHVEKTLQQIQALVDVGCEIVRVAVPDTKAALALAQIRQKVDVPLIADIHFDHTLAIAALEGGVQGLRINPGNIGTAKHVDAVVDCAKAHNAVIRIGVNGGSLEKHLRKKYGGPTPEAMVESALDHVALLEKRGFYDTKISLKSSSVMECVAAYKLLAMRCSYPLHIGITEAGGLLRGTAKSAVGLGILLWEGIGDTLRVSLTADPVEEIKVAYEILRALGLRHYGPEIISCPTCGRTEIDLMSLAKAVEERLAHEKAPIKVAVMGCVVNGPGEAKEADIGLAGGRDKGIIFAKGEVIRSVKGQEALLQAFMQELDKILESNGE